MLSNTQRLNFCYLKIIHILHKRYHSRIIEHILKNKQKNKCFWVNEIIRLIIKKLKMKMKNRTYRCDKSRPSSRHGQNYSKYLIGEKKSGKGDFTSFSQVANIFPRLNFNPILFNSTRTFPTFFKTRQRTFLDFLKTLPNSLTRPHLLPSNFKVH